MEVAREIRQISGALQKASLKSVLSGSCSKLAQMLKKLTTNQRGERWNSQLARSHTGGEAAISSCSCMEGAVSLFELLDAQPTYNQTLTAYNQAPSEYQVSLWKLEQAIGRSRR